MKTLFIGKREIFLGVFVLLLCFSVAYSGKIFFQPVQTTVAEPYYQGEGTQNVVSLAINVDWGEEYLPDMLAALERADVKATFFLTGRWTEKNPELAKELAAKGHEIGNHAYSHASPDQLGLEGNRDEIRRTGEAIEKATGIKPTLYAPPSGERSQPVLEAAEAEGYTTILWSVDTIDWQKPEPEVILHRVGEKVHPGAIILAHPTHSTLEALPALLQDLQNQGYQVVTVSHNLGLNQKEN